MNRANWSHVPAICGLLIGSALPAGERGVKYVETRRVEHVDTYHGTKVADPYRWLEADVRKSKDVAKWVAAQNKVTFGYLASISERDRIRQRLEEIWDYEKFSTPQKVAGRYYFFKNSGRHG